MTTTEETLGEIQSTFAGIGMKTLILNRLHKVTVVWVMLLLCGCQRGAYYSYYTGNLGNDQILGTWTVVSFPEEARTTTIDNCTLTFHKDGTFTASNFPLIMEYHPVEVKYTTERGTWTLIDNSRMNLRSRWSLTLNFNQSMIGLGLDVIEGEGDFELFERTDLDFWIGYTLQRQN